MPEILDVDLVAFERGDTTARRAVVDGTMRSLATGFVACAHDLPAGLLDDAYEMLAAFFARSPEVKQRWRRPESHGQTGYTGLLVETAASAELADWKEMLNWGRPIDASHPLRRRYPERYLDPVLPEDDVPGISAVLLAFHEQIEKLQRRFLRIVAVGLGCDEGFFEELCRDGATLTR